MSAPAATELGCAGIAEAVRGNKAQADAIHDELLKRFESRVKFHNAMHKGFTVEGVRASLAAATAARARAAHAEPAAVHVGPLASVPFVLSSSIDVEGLPTPAGNAVLTAGKAQKDAPVVDSLRRAGAVLFGQANTGELNLGSACAHATHGTTKHVSWIRYAWEAWRHSVVHAAGPSPSPSPSGLPTRVPAYPPSRLPVCLPAALLIGGHRRWRRRRHRLHGSQPRRRVRRGHRLAG